MRKRFLLAAAAALVAATSLLTLATPALAVKATVRVQGLEHEICPPTTVDVTDNLVVTDSSDSARRALSRGSRALLRIRHCE